MRILANAVAVLATIGSVSGRISYGSCNRNIKGMTFSDINFLDGDFLFMNSQRNTFWGLDYGTYNFFNFFRNLGIKWPIDFYCDSFEKGIEPFKSIAGEMKTKLADETDYTDEIREDHGDGTSSGWYD